MRVLKSTWAFPLLLLAQRPKSLISSRRVCGNNWRDGKKKPYLDQEWSLDQVNNPSNPFLYHGLFPNSSVHLQLNWRMTINLFIYLFIFGGGGGGDIQIRGWCIGWAGRSYLWKKCRSRILNVKSLIGQTMVENHTLWKKSLLARVYKDKYFPKIHPLHIKKCFNPSCTWSRILSVKSNMEKKLIWRIGHG